MQSRDLTPKDVFASWAPQLPGSPNWNVVSEANSAMRTIHKALQGLCFDYAGSDDPLD